jgi:hypothetical protein
MDWSFLVAAALAIFVMTQVENSIAKKTADEIERRSKPQVALAPSKWSSVFQSPRFALIGSAIGVIGLLVVMGRGF